MTAIGRLEVARRPRHSRTMDNRLRHEVRPNAAPLIGPDRAQAAIDAHYRWLDQLVIEALRALPKPEPRPDADKA